MRETSCVQRVAIFFCLTLVLLTVCWLNRESNQQLYGRPMFVGSDGALQFTYPPAYVLNTDKNNVGASYSRVQ
jgi:hypothetical protein